MNASLPSIRAGLRPIRQQALPYGGTIFLFPNGQQRRQIGEGHSHFERQLRRKQRRAKRAALKAAFFLPLVISGSIDLSRA